MAGWTASGTVPDHLTEEVTRKRADPDSGKKARTQKIARAADCSRGMGKA